jgi:Zn-finger nucleic acid-binding protein
MQCPVCDERLREVEKYGVTVDICPSCKGVWLDRGELEKVTGMEERGEYARDGGSERDDRRHDHHGGSDNRSGHTHGKPRKRSFLTDLMEGFGD